MITLAILEQVTAQQVYNQVKGHLLDQKEQCITTKGCVYRNDSGLKCAAGSLIGNSEYLPEMDEHSEDNGTSWGDLVERGLVPDTQHNKLISDLQVVHDVEQPMYWEKELMRVALEHDLEP